MTQPTDPLIRKDLLLRQSRLQQAISTTGDDHQLKRLLGEVDAALERLHSGTYGLCAECGDPIESERLLADPLMCLCLDHLTPAQQEALENDLGLASRIQRGLLPERNIRVGGWEATYHYEAASLVSGDYCDILDLEGDLYFVVGDVTGKGVSAAMLMAHLNAMFRTLVRLDLTLGRVMEQASRLFCESTLSTHFATLACGRAASSGEVELCIAGHDPVLLIHNAEVTRIESRSLPLGMFCDEEFSTSKVRCDPGDSIVLYTDGLSEALDSSGKEYGIDRLAAFMEAHGSVAPEQLIADCLSDLRSFRSADQTTDDLTLMAIRRHESGSD